MLISRDDGLTFEKVFKDPDGSWKFDDPILKDEKPFIFTCKICQRGQHMMCQHVYDDKTKRNYSICKIPEDFVCNRCPCDCNPDADLLNPSKGDFCSWHSRLHSIEKIN